jgi:hypothetical protein
MSRRGLTPKERQE